ncbi:unnamed protein product [Paramecium pentaurelia]|uniref:Uncharacterized protein n=1 Tax=Paramecium pentaurelia TaxID=43138 RepID=A0A8S1WU61_9CILI|nr:unnamed protein product [Paramecium pentaurelia]
MNQSNLIEDLNGSNVSRLLKQIKEITQDELYEEMTQLKTRVLGLLKDYQSSLQQKENIRQLNQQIRKDVTNISNDYSQIVEKMNQSVDCTFISIESITPFQKNEKEMNKMFNLVEEFLEKFQGKKANYNLYTSFISDKMERSGISMADTSIIDVNCRISIIKDQISSNLSDKKYSQLVIMETVDALQEALNSQKIEKIRSIIKRIEHYMAQCQHDPSDLYQMLQKAVESCKEKEIELQNQSIIEDKDIKRRFFDLALEIKSELPINHPGRKVLVSVLFEKAQNIDESQWHDWILDQLSQQN